MRTSSNLKVRNCDLLAEIHKSKLTFCSYIDDADANYCAVVSTITEGGIISEGQALANVTDRRDGMVVRVMTFEHVPEIEGISRKNRVTGKLHPTMSFPPFKHYRLEAGEWREVLRSHWSGGIENGHFDNRAGRMTDKLAVLIDRMVTNYARKGNWIGYSYRDEMEADALLNLVERGLNFDESKSKNPFAYFTSTIHNRFLRRLRDEKEAQTFRDDCLEEAGLTPSSSRQAANDLARFEPVEIKRKRGRPATKPKTATTGTRRRGRPAKASG